MGGRPVRRHRLRPRRRGEGPAAARPAHLRRSRSRSRSSAASSRSTSASPPRCCSTRPRTPQRQWLSRRSTSSTASTCCTRAASASPEELRDLLASWVAAQGARGVLVFDGEGRTERRGPLEVRWAKDADTLLEHLAAENRGQRAGRDRLLRHRACAARPARSAEARLADLPAPSSRAASQPQATRGDLRDRLDPDTLAQLERLRRGKS